MPESRARRLSFGALLIACSHLLACSKQGPTGDQPTTAARFVPPAPPFVVGHREPVWFDPRPLLVPSNGSHSLGAGRENTSRDPGSKLVYFDTVRGNNETAEVYWWDGKRIVDSDGEPGRDGLLYGTDPLSPNEAAILTFAAPVGITPNAEGDARLRTHADGLEAVAGGFPDWFLFRRGQLHETFDGPLVGGRSEREPMVVGAYGPLGAGRANIHPSGKRTTFHGEERPGQNPFKAHNSGARVSRVHMVLLGLDFDNEWGLSGTQLANSPDGKPTTAFFEDCRFAGGKAGVAYPPQKSTFRHSVFTGRWNAERHNQAYFTEGPLAQTTFDDVIFYRNGFKSDPKRDPDPKRDIFSRNVYAGGGAQLGHTYRRVISADGASGGPQMRFGGTCEQSLIVEGYWFSSTDSNRPSNPWLKEQSTGSSAIVRDNVQLVFQYPSPQDPDPERASAPAAQPGSGYTLQGGSFGGVVEGNIIAGTLLARELAVAGGAGAGLSFVAGPQRYEAGLFTLQRNVFRNNIVYELPTGLGLAGDWTGAADMAVEGNVFATRAPWSNRAEHLDGPNQLLLRNNRFYVEGEELPDSPLFGEGNRLAAREVVAREERWPDPSRTLRRYVTEALGLSLLDWNDDASIDGPAKLVRSQAGEPYDPTGMKTFMAVATRMRRGGTKAVPTTGKPELDGDYAWDERFTAVAVVNWIRAGFALPPVENR